MKEHLYQLLAGAALGAVVLSSAAVFAGPEPCDDGDRIVIRRTIPYPHAVERAPLTSDQLSTTSTRYIDARRGHRPYDSVHGHAIGRGHRVLVGYDDHFGITRPEDRPYSYSQRAPRTGVTRYENNSAGPQGSPQADAPSAVPIVVIVRDERDQVKPDAGDTPDMRVRIHNDEPEMPSRSGAVLITADGTVIQVGD